jgi:hypothetical protein
MKILALMILLLMGTCAGTSFQMGGHMVSYNLSTHSNYTIEAPNYYAGDGAWDYHANITPNDSGNIRLSIAEEEAPIITSIKLQESAQGTIDYYTKTYNLGGVKYNTSTYKGRDAFELWFPAQQLFHKIGYPSTSVPKFNTMIFSTDLNTAIVIAAYNVKDETYYEFKNSLNITKA